MRFFSAGKCLKFIQFKVNFGRSKIIFLYLKYLNIHNVLQTISDWIHKRIEIKFYIFYKINKKRKEENKQKEQKVFK